MIRPATLADLPRVIDLGRKMHAESRYSVLTYNADKVLALLTMVMQRGLVLVAERDGAIIGAFAGMVEQHWFSDDLVATDLALFVDPGRRGGFAAAAMVDAFVEWAWRRGAKIVDMGINTGIKVEQTAALFDRLGGKQIGMIYTWGKD